jgi:KUP system potassium uptake protein
VALAIGAMGIVYGDIGTSPLYAFREAFEGHDLEVTDDGALGVCSITFWALVLIISVKYLMLVMRADHKGEGGILALTALLPRSGGARRTALFVAMGMFGTALLYGDGMITPAISVLSAVEGIGVATHSLDDWIVPIAVAILAALFLVQRRGTAGIAKVFGPVMVVWFTVIALLGLRNIFDTPSVLKAVNPLYAVGFFSEYHWEGFWALGSIFLVVTGGEALYADMGHFGRRPIQLGWFSFVMPALLLNYFGQGALLMKHPEQIHQPFFLLGPSWSVWPLVVLATIATIIASQALITGAFSLTTQAMQLGYLPRVAVRHTSSSQIGQVYVPIVNWLLMVSCIGLVIGFRSSSNLAAAYGIAVTMTMVITSLLFGAVAVDKWGWSKFRAQAVVLPLVTIELGFFGAQVVKIPHGGWFALMIGVAQFTLMTTWHTGRRHLARSIRRGELPIADFVAQVRDQDVQHVPGTAVFLFKDAGATPPALLLNLAHNKVLHDAVVLLSVETESVAHVDEAERATVSSIGDGIWQVVLRFGYRDEPNVPEALARLPEEFLRDASQITYFLGRETIVVTPKKTMAPWRERLFVMQSRTAASAARFFYLPAERVFEVGMTIEF